jgi:hypothetical protein
MLPTTLDVIRAGLKSDPTIKPSERTQFLALLRSGSYPPGKPQAPHSEVTPRLLRRGEVARRLACSLRTVDKLPVQKVRLPGRTRAAGFLESDINALLAGK